MQQVGFSSPLAQQGSLLFCSQWEAILREEKKPKSTDCSKKPLDRSSNVERRGGNCIEDLGSFRN